MREYSEILKLNKFVMDTLHKLGSEVKEAEPDLFKIAVPDQCLGYFGNRKEFEITFNRQIADKREGIEYIFWGSSFLNQLIEIVREKSTGSCRCYKHSKEITDKYRGKQLTGIGNAEHIRFSQRIEYKPIITALIKAVFISSGKREESVRVNISIDDFSIYNEELYPDAKFTEVSASDLALSPLNLCVAIDLSDKMREKKTIPSLVTSIGKIVELLGEDDHFSVVTLMENEPPLIASRIVQNKKYIYSKIKEVEQFNRKGTSRLFSGIINGFREIGKNLSKKQKNILIIVKASDGEGGSDCSNYLKYKKDDFSIFPVGIGYSANDDILRDIAKRTGGKSFFPEEPDEIIEILPALIDSLKSSNSSPFSKDLHLTAANLEKAMDAAMKHAEELCASFIDEENLKANRNAAVEIEKYLEYAKSMSLTQKEQKLKIENIKSKYALNIDFIPISCCINFIPFLTSTEEYHHDKFGKINLYSKINLLSDAEVLPQCTVCGVQTTMFYLCEKTGHLICEGDIFLCDICKEIRCREHPAVKCSTKNCNKKICEQCKITCRNCGQSVCPDCIQICSYSGQKLCNDCIVTCLDHNSHHVISKKFSVECNVCKNIVCPDHRHACPVCSKDVCSTHLMTCKSGHRAGECCGEYCNDCGAFVCNDHKIICVDCGKAFCTDCVQKCSSSHNMESEKFKEHFVCRKDLKECGICSVRLCREHSFKCTVCGRIHCIDHTGKCSYCGNITCDSCKKVCNVGNCIVDPVHCLTCEICAKDVCLTHACTCRDCKKKICETHTEECSVCRQPVCRECVRHCGVCGKMVCIEHTTICAIGKEILCPQDVVQCSRCNSKICAGHSGSCSICGEIICHNCLANCFLCGEPVCDEHGFTCSHENCGKPVCSVHAKRCHSCQRDFCPEHISGCIVCGEGLCSHCWAICGICGEKACSEHVHKCEKCGKAICEKCSKTCSLCGKLVCAEHTSVCSVGNEILCPHCTHRCHTDNEPVCGKHATICQVCDEKVCSRHSSQCFSSECSQRVCETHLSLCSLCGEKFCPGCITDCSVENVKICKNDSFTCPCCHKTSGKKYRGSCSLCGQNYISTCINDEGICRICSNLKPVSKNDNSIKSAVDKLPFLEKLLSYKYRASEMGDHIIVFYDYFFRTRILIYDNSRGEIIGKNTLDPGKKILL